MLPKINQQSIRLENKKDTLIESTNTSNGLNSVDQSTSSEKAIHSLDELASLKVADIKAILGQETVTEELLEALRQDSRSSVQKLVVSYEKKQEKIRQEYERIQAMYDYEGIYYSQGMELVAGVDEVGRGPIAGPVTVAAVILPPYTFIPGLNDSKKLSEKRREEIYDQIMELAVAVSCVSYDREKIDALNIYEATRQAMYEAVRTLSVKAQAVVADAMKLTDLDVPVESIVKGDAKSANIAAASIIAKVTRDRYMVAMEKEYPGFGFDIHKGYYTDLHREALENQGITPIHRRSFEPIKSMVKGIKE